jgi:hypothetical protein
VLRVTPGESRSVTLYALQQPGVGLVTPSTGAAVELRLADLAGAQVGAPFVASGTAGGDWTALVAFPTITASYSLVALVTLSGRQSPAAVESVSVGPLLGTRGTTRRELRRAIGDELTGGLRILRCTAASDTSTPSTFRDDVNLIGADDFYKAAWLWVSRGAEPNLADAERFVVGSTFGGRSVTVDPPYPAAFAVGDEAELWSMRGAKGIRPQAVHRAIDRYIALAAETGGFPISATVTAAFDASLGTLPIPPGFQTIHEVQAQSPNGSGWSSIEQAGGPGEGGWWCYGGDGVVTLTGSCRSTASGRAMRLFGTQGPDPLASDDDRTQANAEYIVRACVAALIRGALDRDPLNERKIGLYENEAKALLQIGVPIIPPGSVWVVAG